MERRYSNDELASLREWVFPEEDRHLYTTAKWGGSFRWFHDPKVVCIEHYRRVAAAEDGGLISRSTKVANVGTLRVVDAVDGRLSIVGSDLQAPTSNV